MKWYQLSVLLLFLQAPHCLAQTVYTWTDNNGVIHFSDVPDNAKVKAIQLPDHELPAPPPQFDKPEEVDPPQAKEQTKPEAIKPLEVAIASPQHDQALRSNAGMITIQGETNRKLAIGEQLQLMMDGEKYAAPSHKAFWELKNIDRGTHIFMIQAYKDGKLIASSSAITVHLQRATVK